MAFFRQPETEQPEESGLPIGRKEIERATATLKKYKDGKQNLERKVVENEQWWKLRHWELIRAQQKGERPEPASAWLFNSIANKHADAMDNYPEPNVLPRERSDEADAKVLSSVIPVVLERSDFEETYSDNWWYKLKQGMAAYGVFWNSQLENGLGDIDIRRLDVLNLFWEPGIMDIQQSRNLFVVDLLDNDLLEKRYPQVKGRLGGNVIDVKQYIYDDAVDVSDKSVLVDWYYKVQDDAGKTVLHYCKFVGDTVLFASENEPEYADGWYQHGEYPVVFDVLFPEEGTPVGFGLIDIMKDPQMYIDKMSQAVLENVVMGARPRYFVKEGCGINDEEFLDWSKPIVHVEGQIDEERLKPIDVAQVSGNALNAITMKIDELKETSSNRDVSQGSSSGGVTAAAAIAALQEAGNKTSRDMIAAAYRSYKKITYLIIELIRQFYDEARAFRITGEDGQYEFVDYNNANLGGQQMQGAYPGQNMEPGYQPALRRPVFDIVVKPQKRSAYNRLSQNELAKELYGLGFFNPELADQALTALELMEFDGKEKVKERVQQGKTLLSVVQQMQQDMAKMSMIVQALTGQNPLEPGADGGQAGQAGQVTAKVPAGDSLGRKAVDAEKQTMTGYGERLAARAIPNVGGESV